jgi:hypothetical protein
VTLLEVIDDAVKIGLGSLFGWVIARGARETEFEKERRRRKQDCLERVMEDLDESEASIDALLKSGLWAVGIGERSVKYSQQALEDLARDSEKNEAATTKLLYRSKTKLIVFGFPECAAALDQYHMAILDFRTALSASRSDPEKDINKFLESRENLMRLLNALRAALTKAFKTL